MKGDKYGERRGAAFGLSGVVKGFGISCIKKYGIVTVLRAGLEDRYVSQMIFYLSFLIFIFFHNHQYFSLVSGNN